MNYIYAIIVTLPLSTIVGILWAGGIVKTNPKEWETDDES